MTAQVDNKLSAEGGKTSVELKFRHIDDFSPLSIVMQNEALRKLFESRQKLNDLLAKLDGNDALDNMLQTVTGNADEMKQLKAAANGDAAQDGGK
jgi:type VI secretion system protein ImpB